MSFFYAPLPTSAATDATAVAQRIAVWERSKLWEDAVSRRRQVRVELKGQVGGLKTPRGGQPSGTAKGQERDAHGPI